jgi:hypothetical protein
MRLIWIFLRGVDDVKWRRRGPATYVRGRRLVVWLRLCGRRLTGEDMTALRELCGIVLV